MASKSVAGWGRFVFVKKSAALLLHGTAKPKSPGFSLLELLVSMAILALIVLALVTILNSSTEIWRSGASKIQAFQEARAAYESMTRKLSQASLNVYWDYQTDAQDNPVRYKRQSELAFLSGPESLVLPTMDPARTHAVFFQALLGYSIVDTTAGLGNLLNACGYFLEFGDDLDDRPAFLASGDIVPVRYRFRLREIWQPTENLEIYRSTPPSNWIDLTSSATLAENIIALIILPKLPPQEDPQGIELAPEFFYDSTNPDNATTWNQLPPLLQVVMVAIDETSARRAENGNLPPDYGVDWDNLFQKAENLDSDIETMEGQLISSRVNYQIFNSTIAVEGAKWSR